MAGPPILDVVNLDATAQLSSGVLWMPQTGRILQILGLMLEYLAAPAKSRHPGEITRNRIGNPTVEVV